VTSTNPPAMLTPTFGPIGDVPSLVAFAE